MEFPHVNGKQKIGIGAVTTVLVLIGTVIGGLWAAEGRLDSKYAKKTEIRRLESRMAKGLEEVLDSIKNLTCATIRRELNDIAVKEDNNNLTQYDKARRNDLELQWERRCLGEHLEDSRSS